MTHTELRHLIQDIFRRKRGAELVVPIHIIDLQPVGYSIGIEVRQYHPLWLNLEMDDDELKAYLEKELPGCGIAKEAFVRIERNTGLDHKLNSFRSPYDLTRLDGEK